MDRLFLNTGMLYKARLHNQSLFTLHIPWSRDRDSASLAAKLGQRRCDKGRKQTLFVPTAVHRLSARDYSLDTHR